MGDRADQVSNALAARYRVDREIGRGGTATVYLAHDVRHDRDVAIKILHPELSAQVSADRFLREIRVTAQLTHPHILPLLDSGSIEETGQPFYVVPYVAGETLYARIQRDGRLSLDEASRIAREAADALDYANARGVIHRDIKPENILLLEGHAVLADFGIAHAVDAGTSRMTSTGTIVGTPAYMSPEQASGERDVTGRSDQYSLACVTYEMLTGRPPFENEKAISLIAAHSITPAPSVRATRGDVPVEVDAAVRRAMAKNPDERFPSASAFAGALGVPTVRTRNGRKRLAIGAGIVVAALLLGYGAYSRRANADVSARAATAARIAVLPFRSVSPDSSDRYFADGMTDEIISALSTLSGLKVIARSSIDAFGPNRSSVDIAKALAVGNLLEGSVRKDRNRVRITVALSDPSTGESRWNATYDTTLTDVFAVQRTIARAVASALRVAGIAHDTRQLERPMTADSTALVAYFRGLALSRRAVVGFTDAARFDSVIALARIAVGRDANFAAGWALLANTYVQKIFSFSGDAALRDSALTAMTRALALDTTLADGYRARSNLAYTREGGWRHEDALRDALHAVALKPSWADAHATLGSLLLHLGFFDGAAREFATTITLDPQGDFAPFRVPRIQWQTQHFEEALAAYRSARRTTQLSSIDEEALVLGYLGRAEEGLSVLRSAGGHVTQRSGDESAAEAVLLARIGHGAEARAKIAEANRLGRATSHFHHAAFAIATAWALMGERDSAITWLERTADDGMPAYTLFVSDPALASLKGAPRYEALIQRLRVQNDRFRALMENSVIASTKAP